MRSRSFSSNVAQPGGFSPRPSLIWACAHCPVFESPRSNASTPEGYTPLSLATSAGHVEVCRLLLRQGATADARDRSGVTALMHACMHGFAEIAELLLLHGALPTTQNDAGYVGTKSSVYNMPVRAAAAAHSARASPQLPRVPTSPKTRPA